MRWAPAIVLTLCSTSAAAANPTAPNADKAPPKAARAIPSTLAPVAEVELVAGPETKEVIEVRVIGVRADSMQKVPGSGTVLTRDEITRAAPLDAAEILRRLPGFHVRQDAGAGGRLDIGIRGLDPGRSRRVLLLEDGVPIGNNPYAEPDLYWSPPPQRWAGVEVVKGSGNILFGPQTVGGVVNFVTPHAPWRREARLEVIGGQRGFVHGLARYGDRHGEVGYLAQVLFRRGDGFREQAFRTIDSFGKLDFPTSPSGRATLKIGVHDATADADDVGLSSAMFAVDPRRPTLAPNNRSKLRRYHASLVHEHRFSDIVSLKTLAYGYTLGRTWHRQDYVRFPVQGVHYTRIVGDPSVPKGALYFESSHRVLDRNYEVAGIEPRAEFRFATGPVHHTIDVGTRVLGERAHYEQRAGTKLTTDSGALVLDETRSTLATAAYIQDRMAFHEETILVTPGIRFEYARYHRRIDRQPTAEGAQDVNTTGDNHIVAIVPGIGMTVGKPSMHGFAGLHLGFAPPRAVSSIRADGATVDLDEEKSLSYEAGVRLKRRRRWRLHLAGFLGHYFNQIVPASLGDRTTLTNGGATRQLGIESDAKLSFGHLIGRGTLLDLGARYTLMRAQFVGGDSDGRQLPYAPNHLLHLLLDLGHAIGAGAQLAYSYVGAQYTDDMETLVEDVTGRTGRLDAYHRLDANLRYRHPRSGLTATLAVKDLLDRPFITSRRPEGIFAAGFRQITFGLRWDYGEAP